MNIKELVLVISILLSIRIAEYAMKKYKEQKDVEVTKKQKSRKQTKKYIITAPSILKVGLPCGIFFGLLIKFSTIPIKFLTLVVLTKILFI